MLLRFYRYRRGERGADEQDISGSLATTTAQKSCHGYVLLVTSPQDRCIFEPIVRSTSQRTRACLRGTRKRADLLNQGQAHGREQGSKSLQGMKGESVHKGGEGTEAERLETKDLEDVREGCLLFITGAGLCCPHLSCLMASPRG